jgi:hypothetical protein
MYPPIGSSRTWGFILWRLHENAFEKYPDVDSSASIIWLPILENDTLDATIPSVKFLCDSRIQHFYDNKKAAGKAIARNVGWDEKVAWDIYLFYQPYVEWTDKPPRPTYWMHQLSEPWAKNENYRTGKDLQNELFVSMKNLI